MRRFVTVYSINLLQLTLIGVLALGIYAYFPTQGFTARVLATVLVSIVFVGAAALLICGPKFLERSHALGALALGIVGGVLLVKVGFGQGWGTTLRAVGLVCSWLGAVAGVTAVTHRVDTGHWRW